MRTDVRIRIRGGVIRVRIGETCIRTVIRVTAEQHTTRMTHLLCCYLIVFIFIQNNTCYRCFSMSHGVGTLSVPLFSSRHKGCRKNPWRISWRLIPNRPLTSWFWQASDLLCPYSCWTLSGLLQWNRQPKMSCWQVLIEFIAVETSAAFVSRYSQKSEASGIFSLNVVLIFNHSILSFIVLSLITQPPLKEAG